MTRIDLPARPRILVVALRRLGDVLLTTPLIRSLRAAWPEARLDALVFADTTAILDGNPDLDNVIAMPQPAGALQSLALMARLWRRYDLAVSTQAGDRPTIFTIVAGRRRAGPVQARLSGRVFRLFFDRWLIPEGVRHRVEENLQFAELIGIAPLAHMVAPSAALPESVAPQGPYAVIHAAPFFRYKQWHVEGWRDVARHLAGRGLEIVASGGPGEKERAYLDRIWNGADVAVRRLDGRLSWPQLASLLAGAQIYVGPDTSVTHLAAATGCPVVALYGPTDPRTWGPWPREGLATPWLKAGTTQQRGNVWLLQNPLPCMPCQLEGCLRRLDSHSQCLDELPARQVIAAADQALASVAMPVRQGGAGAGTPL
jgi:heptosyltransferase-3